MLAAESLRLDLPPVRSVRLAYYLQTPNAILSLHAGELRRLWHDSYPDASELAPRAPVNGGGSEALELDDSDRWPVPFFNFDNNETEQGIFFQSDRFGVGWNFGERHDFAYPGFDALAEEMSLRYRQFLEIVSEPPVVLSAECYYRNELPQVSVSDYTLGFLTGWVGGAECVGRLDDEGISFSQHYHLNNDADRPIWLNASSGEDRSTTLRLTTRCEGIGDKEPEEALRSAHAMLISCFLEATSDPMRVEWGQQ